MGLVWSWLRGSKDSLTERKRAMESAQLQIKDVDQRLKGFKGTHRWAVWTLVKAFAVLELLLGVWYWLHAKPLDIGLLDASPLVLWPMLAFALKRAVDWFYGLRIRRDETKLRALYDEQRALLKAIENDPVFQQNLELLKQFGKDVPNYRAPALPSDEQPDVRRRPVAPRPVGSGGGDAMVRPATAPAPSSPAGKSLPSSSAASANRAPAASPAPVAATPLREYTQPVARAPASARKPAAAQQQRSGTGGMFGWLVDAVVGDGLELSVPLNCRKCGTNNGLVSREEAEQRQSFTCVACHELNAVAAGASSDASASVAHPAAPAVVSEVHDKDD